MNVVPDTNFVLSGFLWEGVPRCGIILAESGKIRLCGTNATYKEFCRVISYPKFATKLNILHFSPQRMALDYLRLVSFFPNPEKQDEPIVKADPDDDIFLYAAMAANARIIVTGDSHLLQLKKIMGIYILKPAELLELINLLDRKRKPSARRFPKHPRLIK